MNGTQHRLRFYVTTLPNVPWDELLARYQSFEELGFDTAAIARETKRIRISTCVSQIPLRDLAMLAFQA